MSSVSSLPRYALSLPVAALVAVSLGALMQALVAQKEIIIDGPPQAPDIQIISKRVITPPVMGGAPTPPEDVAPPDRPQITIPEAGEKPGLIPYNPPTSPLDGTLGPGADPDRAPSGLRRLFDPIVEYPANMNRDGSCRVSFTVAASGAVVDPSIVSCTHNGFARAALAAASRASYLPAQGAHGPVATEGVTLTIEFRMPQD